MFKWLKGKLGITALEKENADMRLQIKNLEKNVRSHHDFVSAKMADLKEYTRVDADVGFRGNNTVILTGVYRRKAYIYFYDLGDGEFEQLVDTLKYMHSTALIRHIDAPPHFRGTFDL